MGTVRGRWVLHAALGLLLGAAAGLCGAQTEQAETRLTVHLEDLAVRRTRLWWSNGQAELLYSECRSPGLLDEAAVGFAWRGLVAGRVRPTGLLRQLSNPLGFQPDSAVYREPGGLELDRAVDPVSRRGGELRLAGGHLALLAFLEAGTDEETAPLEAGDCFPARDACAGVRLGLRPGADGRAGVAGVELLGLVGEPHPRLDFQEWFPGEVPYPGGLLAQGAAQLRVEASDFDLRLSAALSGAQRLRPGIWGSAGGGLRRGAWEARFLAGACGRDYRVPGGQPVSERLLSAASLRWRARPGTTVEMSASRLLRAAADLRGERLNSEDRVRLRLRACGLPAVEGRRAPLQPGDQLLLEVGVHRGTEQGSHAAAEARVCLRGRRAHGNAGAGPGRRWAQLGAELSARLEPGGEDPFQSALALSWRRGSRISLGLEAEAALGPEGQPQVEGALTVWGEGSRLRCRLRASGSLRSGCASGTVALDLRWQAGVPASGPHRARRLTSPSSRR